MAQGPVFPPLPPLEGGRAASAVPLRIAIVTPEIAGPGADSDLGTSSRSLAESLARAGHEVTVLYVPGELRDTNEGMRYWVDDFAKRHVHLIPFAEPELSVNAGFHARLSYLVFQSLRQFEPEFDVIRFPERAGLGYYSMLARQQGLAFRHTTFVVGTHGPTMWTLFGNEELPDVNAIELDFMERQCVAMADVAISPSQYMLRWMLKEGWMLPERSYVQPHILAPEFRRVPAGGDSAPIDEVVFFGRLETRKGLHLFCRALDRLRGRALPSFAVTFLGQPTLAEGQPGHDFVRQRAQQWPWPCQVVDNLDHEGAAAYLRKPRRLAIMPSLTENSPNTVLECLGEGIPFLASNVGGIPELIAPEDRDRVCFDTRPAELAGRIEDALLHGARRARPALDFAADERVHVQWHQTLRQEHRAEPNGPLDAPLVSVCLTHHERPALLRQALDSLRAQDYPNYEIILVDDGSTDAATQAYLLELEPEFQRRGWQIVRQENRWVEAARNTGAAHARGEYLLFMDDDNYARPNEVSTFVRVAERTRADILTCAFGFFYGTESPEDSEPGNVWVPLGSSPLLGVFTNRFGDTNAFVRRDAFERLKGFADCYGLALGDWEFFARAALLGLRIEPVPEPLFWYRVHGPSMGRGETSLGASLLYALGPYLDAMAEPLRYLPLASARLYQDTLRPLGQSTSAPPDRPEVTPTPSSRDPDPPVPSMEVPVPAAEAQDTGVEDSIAQASRAVDLHWNSRSWGATAPLRHLARRIRGLPREQVPEVDSVEEAVLVIEAIRNSTSWELMGPLRAIARLLRREGRGGFR